MQSKEKRAARQRRWYHNNLEKARKYFRERRQRERKLLKETTGKTYK